MFITRIAVSSLCFFMLARGAVAQEAGTNTQLNDVTGDAVVSITAFGDSITYGVGDGIAPGEFVEAVPPGSRPGGYTARLRSLLGVSVSNAGVPGEELVAQGIFRVPSTVARGDVDIFIVMEGSNDAVKQVSSGAYARALQRTINVARALGRTVVIVTPPPPAATHVALRPYTDAYSAIVRDLANVNGIPGVDLERVWATSCPVPDECSLYNLPEGLHPNTRGYDAIGQAVAAALVGVDVYAVGGAAMLEVALGLAPGTVIIGTR